eukprot:CAMPEP_0196592824 /NCGR_PEP_ID=MMETSP1081-20130531/73902_1 /TAXON_ID=36882 /ORGANISM="Pyramimonas amylifera, Strain CCMP720" /LENGTH=692 /DNA_ID=CAMNT_0041916629 /DNA_START=117 /DNA_END=2195 /DNA_ORIENTATION=-
MSHTRNLGLKVGNNIQTAFSVTSGTRSVSALSKQLPGYYKSPFKYSCRAEIYHSGKIQSKLTLVQSYQGPTRTAVTVGDAPDKIVGPNWDNSDVYSNLKAARLESDLLEVEKLTEKLQQLCKSLDVEQPESVDVSVLVSVAELKLQAGTLLNDVQVFASCEQSTNGLNAEAKQVLARTRSLSSKLEQAIQPHTLMLRLAPHSAIQDYLTQVPAESFLVQHARKLRDTTLSLAEENIITALSLDGHSAWGHLYDAISSTLKCEVGGEVVGVAKAAGLLNSADEKVRREAYNSIQAAWRGQEEAAAGGLNSITGWRLELNKQRSAKAGRDVHFLEAALHGNHMTQATLDAMMEAVGEAKSLGQRCLRLQAKARSLTALHPADLLAPPPTLQSQDGKGRGSLQLEFEAGMDVIAEAVGSVGMEVKDFVRKAQESNWIEGGEGSARMPGAYCTSFESLRAPRVYLSSFTGSAQHVSTLAHELGHAYHSWVMRDMPLPLTRYPMNLAETASIFFETVVGDRLLTMAQSPQERMQYGWADATSAAVFLLNIPTRFDFECALYEARSEGRVLTPDDFRGMMTTAWEGRYGDTLTEMDSMFWASKLHFHLTSIQFYNFPYTFGYLFSLGVYAQQDIMGEGFKDAYVNLLRDTGSMTAEEVVMKHLGANIEEVEFWRGSIRIIEAKIDAFEQALKECGVEI